ncbi:hypothetical protein HHI36_018379 [Cryptolaemus montrouzieri]|uniref:Reverse transcriptase domain-containing protein n=1 Tax=Cryptolaemus montrouzieri TaxID=559131 RepID=A0ABD2P0R1_9CUCU
MGMLGPYVEQDLGVVHVEHEEHEDELPCDGELRCILCGEPHLATYRGCSEYIRQGNIREIMALHNLSLYEADHICESKKNAPIPSEFKAPVKTGGMQEVLTAPTRKSMRIPSRIILGQPTRCRCVLKLVLWFRLVDIFDETTNKILGPIEVKCGLPRGSVISPKLYNLYSSVPDDTITGGVVSVQYADDKVIMISRKNLERMGSIPNENLMRINELMSGGNLNISVTKSKTIY